MTGSRVPLVVLWLLAVALLASGCGDTASTILAAPSAEPSTSRPTARGSTPAPAPPARASPTLTATVVATPHRSSAQPATVVPRPDAAPAEQSPAEPAPPPDPAPPAQQPLPERVGGLGGASQLLAVTSSGYDTTHATLTAWERAGDGWEQVLGPWEARIGRSGFAEPGAKREGDGATPTGTYTLTLAFGVQPDPGTALPYRPVERDSVWVDDPDSPAYNTWADRDDLPPGTSAEPLYVPAYDLALVIDHNTERTPGLGSAIFLHVSTGRATAGCVSLAAAHVDTILRWLDPTREPRIAMGPEEVIAPS